MSKKVVYHISGFDCPNCAAKSENHLRKQKEIERVSIDFQNEKLFITFKDKELSIEEIKERIAQVESDELDISLVSDKKLEEPIFDKEFLINLSRIVISVLIAIFTKIFVNYHDNFVLALVLYSLATLICLYDILFEIGRNIIKKNNPVDINLLMSISSIGVIVLGTLIHYEVLPNGPFEIDLLDGALVVALYQVGELFEHISTNKSKRAIKATIDLRADHANLLEGDVVREVNPSLLNINDKIIIRVGEVIPVDGIVVSGSGTLDTSSLTGEPLPISVKENHEVLSGTILKSGSLTLLVTKEFANSTVSKIMDLVENSGEHKAKAEKFITRFARIYTPVVFVVGIAYALIYGFVTGVWPQAIFGGLAILVVACPCAIVISVPLAFFAGIGLASRHGIIIKGSNYLDSLCKIGTLFIDKTGTLTYAQFKIEEIHPNNCEKQELLDALYIAESRSNHPIAKTIVKDIDLSSFSGKISSYEELPGEGIRLNYEGKIILAGTKAFLGKQSVICGDIASSGTVVHVSKNGAYLGYVVLKDEIRKDAKESIEKLHSIGVEVVLLSGDKKEVVEEVSSLVGIDKYYSSLLPNEKTKFVVESLNKKKLIAFAGDGVNDTPSIVAADVGFAMGGIGSDVAVENADVVLMEDNPRKIYTSIKIAKKTKHVAIFNIIVSLFVKLGVIILILLGVLGQFGMIIAVLADTGLSVLMILNSLLLFYRKVD